MKYLQKKSATIPVLIATMLLTISFLSNCDRASTHHQPVAETNEKNKQAIPFIRPPLQGENITYTSYRVQSGKDTILTHSTGSIIRIPINAFVDKDGKTIKGQVTINYREMHNAWEILASGIPMTFKKDSITYDFESAGMFDIQGNLNNQPVFLAKGKTIHVEMVSDNTSSRFNNYYLDTIRKNWVELGKSKLLQNSLLNKIEKDSSLTLLKILVAPLKPRNADSVIKIIYIRIANRQQFPEFDAFQNLKFEVVEDHGQYNPSKVPMNCESPEIIPSEDKPGFYQLKMKVLKKDNSYLINWLVRPAFEGYDYEKAMSIYTGQLNKYKEELKRREEQKIEMEKAKKREKTLAQVYRAISVNQLGIYNCDYPMITSWPDLIPEFLTIEGKSLKIQQILVINKSINCVFKYDLSMSPKIKIDPKARQILIGISSDAIMYVNLPNSEGDMDFTWKNSSIAMQRYEKSTDLKKLVINFTKKK